MLDLLRVAPSADLQTILEKEIKFLYGMLSLLIRGNMEREKIDIIVTWASKLGADIQLNVYETMYVERLKQIDLEEFIPSKFLFSFSVIWDSIHLLCLIADDIIINRELYESEMVSAYIRNLKWVFYNMFVILFCPVCARHFLTIDTFPFEFERIEVALFREKNGEPIVLAEEEKREHKNNQNFLYKYNLLYKSMIFHNHVNNYRAIQQNNKELNNFQRMEWTLYKKYY